LFGAQDRQRRARLLASPASLIFFSFPSSLVSLLVLQLAVIRAHQTFR
jgi:hypothetical protein